MYNLDDSDDDFLPPASGSKGKKKEDVKRSNEGKKREKDDFFFETEKIEKFIRDDAVMCVCVFFLISLSLDSFFLIMPEF
jgi:hypothetical protein